MKNSRYVVSPRKSFNRRPVSSFGRKLSSRRPVNSFGRKLSSRRPVNSFGRKLSSRRPVNSFGGQLELHQILDLYDEEEDKKEKDKDKEKEEDIIKKHEVQTKKISKFIEFISKNFEKYKDDREFLKEFAKISDDYLSIVELMKSQKLIEPTILDEKIRFITKNFYKNVSNASSRVKQRNFNSNLPQQLPTFKESDESNLPQQLPTIKESDESNDSIEELLALYKQNEKNISSLGDLTKETNNIAYGEKFALLQDYTKQREFLTKKIRDISSKLDENEQEIITQRMITLKNSGGNDGRRRKSRRSKRRSKKHSDGKKKKSRRSKRRSKKHSDGKRRKSRRSRRKHSKKY